MIKKLSKKQGDSPTIMIKYIRQSKEYMMFASKRLRNDFGFMCDAIENKVSLREASPTLMKNIKLIKRSISYNGVDDVPFEFRDDEKIVLEIIKTGTLNFASERFRDNVKMVIKAVKYKSSNLKFASDNLRNNFDVVYSAIKNNPSSLKHASYELRNNEEIVYKALHGCHCTIQYVSEELRNNKEIMMKAVGYEGLNLKFASDTLKNDFDLVMKAVTNNGCSLKFASDDLRKDYDIIKQTAITKKCSEVIEHNTTIINDRETDHYDVCDYKLVIDPYNYGSDSDDSNDSDISSDFENDSDSKTNKIHSSYKKVRNSKFLYLIHKEKRTDLDIIKILIKNRKVNLESLDFELKKNYELIYMCLNNCHKDYKEIPDSLGLSKYIFNKNFKNKNCKLKKYLLARIGSKFDFKDIHFDLFIIYDENSKKRKYY
jgi:hypothetical protein